MRSVIIALLLFSVQLSAQHVKTYEMADALLISGLSMTESSPNTRLTNSGVAVDAADVDTVLFIFDDEGVRNKYSGAFTVYIRSDSTDATFSNDSTEIVAWKVNFDVVGQQYEMPGNPVANKDSVVVNSTRKWLTGHSPNEYQFSKDINFGVCDAVAFTIRNFGSGSGSTQRITIKSAEDRL